MSGLGSGALGIFAGKNLLGELSRSVDANETQGISTKWTDCYVNNDNEIKLYLFYY